MRYLFILLLLVVVAALGYYGYTTYNEIVQIEETQDAHTDNPSGESAAAPPRKVADPISDAMKAETKGDWQKAAELYKAAEEAASTDLPRKKREAIERVLLGEQSEAKGNLALAIASYKEAVPLLSNPSLISARIERLEQHVHFNELCEKGTAAEKEGKWAEAARLFHEAREIAPQADVSSAAIIQKVQENRARAEQLERALDGYYWLFHACSAIDDPYATMAACHYYAGLELFRSFLPELERRRADAVQSVLPRRKEFPRLSATEDQTFVTVQLKTGGAIEGGLISEDDVGIVLSELRDGKYRQRLVAKAATEKVERRNRSAEDVNNEQAEALLGQAARVCVERRREALGVIGRLLHEFPDASILDDVHQQRRVIVTASLQVSQKHGDSLPKLLASNVEFLEKVCIVCGGTGRAICPACKGVGEVFVKCPDCRGAGETFCGQCAGVGKVRGGGRCPSCRGTGVRRCGKCMGDGGFHTVCTKCSKGYLPTCSACRGTGARPKGKIQPDDYSKLKRAVEGK